MKLIEQALNVLSSSEIRVALLPVGAVPEEKLREYEELVQKYRHVRKDPSSLAENVASVGDLGGATLQPSSLSCLYASRAVLGVIGLCHCPSSPDIPHAYAQFEDICKQFPNSVTVRCFAFEPVTDEMSQNGRQKEHLVMFPKCDPMELEHNVEVFMHDFAAYLLMELQQGMLNLSVGMMSLTTVVDQPEIFGYTNATDEITKRLGTEEEVKMRRRHTRMQKLFGDWSMLAGSPRDAYEHYNTCVELSRYCGDAIWGAAAVEGMAEAKVLEALIETDAIPKRDPVDGTESMGSPSHNGIGADGTRSHSMRRCRSSIFDECAIGYGDQRMWKSIRQMPDLQNQISAFYTEAEGVYARRGILPLQIEVQMKTVRMFIAFQGMEAKARVNTSLTRVLELWPRLKSEFDRMNIVIEVAQILKIMGLTRKRAFLIWQALDSVHLMQTSDVALISLALKVTPLGCSSEISSDVLELQRSMRHLTQNVFSSPHWPALHKAMAEAILPTASKAGMEIIVWESAATLLRDFCASISQERQQMLMDVLKRASSQMGAADKTRHSLGPPPFFQVRHVSHLPDHLKPQICDELMDKASQKDDGLENAFIFNPYAAKRKSDARNEQQEMFRWVVGEECSLEVYISNPCSVQLKIERLCLCVEESDSEAPRATPISVAVVLPPKTKPTRVSLAMVPHFAGPLRVIGCHVTLYGVTWVQRFVASLRRVTRLPGVSLVDPEWGVEKNMVVELEVIPSLPLLKWQFLKGGSNQAWPASLEDTPRPSGSSQSEKEKHLNVNIRAGQRLDFKIRITNVSNFPVLRAKLIHDSVEGISGDSDSALMMKADDSLLVQKLPMFPNDVAEMAVRVLVGHRAAAGGLSNNRDMASQVKLLYGGPHSDAVSKTVMFGRELTAPLSFKIHPSANIVTIQISQHYVPLRPVKAAHKKLPPKQPKSASHGEMTTLDETLSRPGDSLEEQLPSSFSRRSSSLIERSEDMRRYEEAQGTSGNRLGDEIYQFRSEAVLRATIANHDTQVLCVWMGAVPNHQTFQQPQWVAPAAPVSHSVVPGQAVQVSCTIPVMPADQSPLEQPAIESLAIQWMRTCLCGFWQSVAHQPTFTEHDASPSHDPIFSLNPSYGSQGTVPIRREHISRVLSPTLLASIVPAYVTLSIQLAEPFSKGFTNLKDVIVEQPDLAALMASSHDTWSLQAPDYESPASDPTSPSHSDLPSDPRGNNGEIWGIQTEVGEFLNCEVIVQNNSGRDLSQVCFTICSERLDEGGMTTDVLFRRENGLSDAGMLLIGRVSNIPITTSSSTFTHKLALSVLGVALQGVSRFGLCCVMPGLYQVYVCEKALEGELDEIFVPGFRLNVSCK